MDVEEKTEAGCFDFLRVGDDMIFVAERFCVRAAPARRIAVSRCGGDERLEPDVIETVICKNGEDAGFRAVGVVNFRAVAFVFLKSGDVSAEDVVSVPVADVQR